MGLFDMRVSFHSIMTQQKFHAKWWRSFLSISFLHIQGNPCLVGLKRIRFNEELFRSFAAYEADSFIQCLIPYKPIFFYIICLLKSCFAYSSINQCFLLAICFSNSLFIANVIRTKYDDDVLKGRCENNIKENNV